MIALVSSINAPILGSMLSYPLEIKNSQELLFVLIIFAIISIVILAFTIKETFGKTIITSSH